MIAEYISLNKYDKQLFLHNILHDIKYNSDLDSLRVKYDLKSEAENYYDEFLQDLCVLATYIEQAFINMSADPPEWVCDERLYLPEPYFGFLKTPEVVFLAPQACYRHNVFLMGSAFEVI